ncbi:MAG: hypothetical protein EHM41_18660, partial [Chloroflexi bacterium]
LAWFTRDILGANWAVNQDGGGSSTMVVNGKVVNQPAVPCYKVYLPNVAKEGIPGQPVIPGDPNANPVSTACQRPVGNGIMMVEVVPPAKSQEFSSTRNIIISRDTGLYLGPGTNYPAPFIVPYGMTGTIEEPLNGLNGIFAKGIYWWKVTVGGQTGWVPGDAIHQALVLKMPRGIMR